VNLFVWLGVGVLGGLGALLRFCVDRSISQYFTFGFPAGTFAINLSGAFLLGVLSASKLGATPNLLLGAAAIGSYTTFSTWMFESHRLSEDGRTALMAVNLSLSLVLGFAACAIGRYVGGAM
jgi:fluoride exporter